MVNLPISGGCHCGALRYEIREAPLMAYNCHCRNCQKIGGGAFSVAMAISESSFGFTHGEPGRIDWKAASGNRRHGWFCRDCGSRIAHGQTDAPGVLSLRAGTIDDTSWVEPVGDIWTTSAQPWVKFIEGGLRADHQPTDYGQYVARFRAQGRFAI